MNVAQETLGLRRGSFSLPLSLLMSAFALLIPPENLTILLRRLTERSPTAHTFPLVHSSKVVGAADKPLQERERLDFDGRFARSQAARSSLWNELKWIAYIRSFGVQFEPRYIFRAGRLDQ